MGADFTRAFGLTIGYEGSTLDRNPEDTGNWTSGIRGVGALKGSKFGISAAAYPSVDIPNLTLADAQAIYQRDYWTRAGCEDLPWPLCAQVFDAAVNNGVGRAQQWLKAAAIAAQGAAGLVADGVIGPQTKAALARPEIARAAALEFVAQRMNFMGGLAGWRTFGLGWARRLVAQAALT